MILVLGVGGSIGPAPGGRFGWNGDSLTNSCKYISVRLAWLPQNHLLDGNTPLGETIMGSCKFDLDVIRALQHHVAVNRWLPSQGLALTGATQAQRATPK